MSRFGIPRDTRRLAWLTAAVVALLTVLAVLWEGGEAVGSSSLARGPQGWRGLRAVVESRGLETITLDRPLEDAPREGTWVLAFPWSGRLRGDEAARIREHLEAGGHVLLAYSGARGAVWEGLLLEDLGLGLATVRPDPPLSPLAWYRHARQVHRLEAATGWSGARPRPLVVPAPDVAPVPPPEARTLYQLPGAGAAAFTLASRGGGRLVVVPAAALANAWLGEPGNADLLAGLREHLDGPWVFDEYHHGLVAPAVLEGDAHVRRALDGVLLHLLALWALGVWALARRLGPPWREETPVTGSTGAFLRGLGRLHHRRGHHVEGARRLVRRRIALAGPGSGGARPGPAEERDPRAGVVTGGDFLALARRWSPGEAPGPGTTKPDRPKDDV